MAGVIILIENKADVIEAPKMKIHLKTNRVNIGGFVFLDDHRSTEFIQDMMRLEEVGPIFKSILDS